MPAPVAGDTLAYSLEPFPYHIAPGDVLFVDYGLVLDQRAITAEVIVRPDGYATLPRVGDVKVAGLSTSEADSTLAELYADVYVNPNITVAVRQVAGNLVHVLGQVRSPGSYPIQPNATVLQAIAQAGGFQDDASRGDVLVLRRMGPSQATFKKINIKDLIKHRQGTSDVLLRRYDIVYVNRSTIGDVNVFANKLLSPLISAADVYLRGWSLFNIDRVFPVRTTQELTP